MGPTPWETGESRASDIVIRLATFGPGDEIVQYFGHTALEVTDTRLRVSRLYNFGMFSFGPDMLPKFLMGRLEFWLGVQPPGAAYHLYRSLQRDVRISELNLPAENRLAMAKALADNARPENRVYLYHHYYDNCATRIVDAIDAAVDGQFKAHYSEPIAYTFRDFTHRYTAHDPLIDWVLVFLMNDEMETPLKQTDAMFLPVELEDAVTAFSYDNRGVKTPLVSRSVTLAEAVGMPVIPDEPPTTWPYTLLLGLALLALSLGLGAWHRRRASVPARVLFGLYELLFGLTFGVLGLGLFIMSCFTEHTVTYWNENLFFANPVTFALTVLGVGTMFGARWAMRSGTWAFLALSLLSTLGMLLKVLPMFEQENLFIWTVLLPANLAGFVAARWMSRGELALRELWPFGRA